MYYLKINKLSPLCAYSHSQQAGGAAEECREHVKTQKHYKGLSKEIHMDLR